MTTYYVGIGHDVAFIDMDLMLQQPMGDPVAPVERNDGASGVHHNQGGYVIYHFEMINSPAEYQALLAQFDLNDNETAEVTVIARNDRLYDRRYNGLAHRPEPKVDMKWSNVFLRDVELYVTDLEEIA